MIENKMNENKMNENKINENKINNDVFLIGCHLSSSGGYNKMLDDMFSINANTFQFFTRNPRGSSQKALDIKDIDRFNIRREEHNIGVVLAHAPYTLNPCSDKESVREFANMVLNDDIERLEIVKNTLYNFHPGSHLGQGSEIATSIIAEALNRITDKCLNTTILLETMAGKGTETGRTFEELRSIIDKVHHKEVLGVCLDTCHIFDAGYDIVNNLDGVLEEFDKIIGLERLKAIHLNDSKNILGSRKDRHEKIGEGNLGIETIKTIINHDKIRNLPFYLETPNDLKGHGEEIALLKSIRK